MKKIIMAIVLFSMPLSATSIVLIRNQQGVFIGADSRIVDESGASLGKQCKVIKMGRYYFANAGLGRDESFDFDIKEIARHNFLQDVPFENCLEQFIRQVEQEYNAYLLRIKNEREALYNRILRGHVNIETVIVGREEGVPFFRVIKFSVSRTGSKITVTTSIDYSCPGDCAYGKAVAMVGQMHHTAEFVDKEAFNMIKNPVRAINFLVNREIMNSSKVGPPIIILKIGHRQNEWIQHDEICIDK